jgi:hypothetical protein
MNDMFNIQLKSNFLFQRGKTNEKSTLRFEPEKNKDKNLEVDPWSW